MKQGRTTSHLALQVEMVFEGRVWKRSSSSKILVASVLSKSIENCSPWSMLSPGRTSNEHPTGRCVCASNNPTAEHPMLADLETSSCACRQGASHPMGSEFILLVSWAPTPPAKLSCLWSPPLGDLIFAHTEWGLSCLHLSLWCPSFPPSS